jgi:hypothetical protein
MCPEWTESLDDAMVELSPRMWQTLLPGRIRAIVKSTLDYLFSDFLPADPEKLIRDTEAEDLLP